MNTILAEDATLLTGVLDSELSLTNTITESLLWWFSWYVEDSLLIGIIIFVWALIIVWIIKDSNYRSSSLLFQVCSILLVTIATPLVGIPIYIAIRPLWYKHERKYRELIMAWYTIDTWSYDDNATNDNKQSISLEKGSRHVAKPKKKPVVL